MCSVCEDSASFTCKTWTAFPQTTHFARVVRTDGDAELCLDEGVVDQVSHIFERLPVVFTDTVTKLQLDPQNNKINRPFSQPF